MASSSSSSPTISSLGNYYDVFISFRGDDTRHGFASHLYTALCEKNIKTYMDENDLEKGDKISPALMKAIRESRICVILLSENYASSSWCLDEVTYILQCKEKNEQIHVIPIFYQVDPSDVRKQDGSYKDAFDAHEKRFKDEMDKVQKWRDALREVADLSGWDSTVTRLESRLINDVVNDINKKLDHYISSSDDDDDNGDIKDKVGIDEPIKQIVSSLGIGAPGVRIIGIWGMGGIGKTTLARVIFNRFCSKFNGYFFLDNVKEELKNHQPNELRKRVFSELLKEENLKEINKRVRQRLCHRKVLFVLDDVDNIRHLECLPIGHDSFGNGSRLIVTTRDIQVLKNLKADKVHKVKGLNRKDALRLFYSKAFQGNPPSREYTELSERVVTNYDKGNPLAVKVLGGHLHSKSTEEWKGELEKLKSTSNQEVHDVLKISYDGLSPYLKNIFLDIACFFTGRYKDEVERILASCYSGVKSEIRDLIDKSLISINDYNIIIMHDLLQFMGREIVLFMILESGADCGLLRMFCMS